jgi:WD40 repeat protein
VRHRHGRLVIALTTALTAGAIALSPAGATVGRLITRALGVRHASPALSSLPASGRLLVSGPTGTWTVAADGALRRLGSWTQASWSPHGLYVAVAKHDQLAAIDPRGATVWTLSRPSVSAPRWYSPSGNRIAYISAGNLRVVAGDGTGDHLLASRVAGVAPAWRPGYPYQLAYVTNRRTLIVRDGDTGHMLFSAPAQSAITQLEWSASGRYLLAVSATTAWVYDLSGAAVSMLRFGSGARVIDAAVSPDGRLLAVVLGGNNDELALERLGSRHPSPGRVLAGPGLGQVLWSPDGHWLLISWPTADQWVFARVSGASRIAAVSHIAQQFGHRGLPRLDGWCCAAGPVASQPGT